MVTEIRGVAVGHWTDKLARTGCTVVLLPSGTVASGEVRGGAPATREFALLAPQRTVETIDAVVLSGGSAFGLSTADGVVSWLEERERGYPTKAGPIPIVVGMALYDLTVGQASIRPTAAKGRTACESASINLMTGGQIGAGTGATVGKWGGPDTTTDAGFGTALVQSEEIRVWAGVAVNAVGFLSDGTESEVLDAPHRPAIGEQSNTTIGVVVTNAIADKTLCHRLTVAGHDGLARSIYPAHTAVDGDALVVAATQESEADPMHLAALVQSAITQAIRSLI